MTVPEEKLMNVLISRFGFHDDILFSYDTVGEGQNIEDFIDDYLQCEPHTYQTMEIDPDGSNPRTVMTVCWIEQGLNVIIFTVEGI